MLIVSVRDNENNRNSKKKKKIDEREMQKKKKKKNQRRKRTRGDRSHSERVRANRFCCAFKLGFLQLICKASLIFQTNLELALSIDFGY